MRSGRLLKLITFFPTAGNVFFTFQAEKFIMKNIQLWTQIVSSNGKETA